MFSTIIRKLFAGKPPAPAVVPVTIPLGDGSAWLDGRRHDIEHALGPQLQAFSARFVEARNECLAALHALEQARLSNPNLPKRALALMEGNRREYSRQVRRLLDELAALPSRPAELAAFFPRLVATLASFAQGSLRSYTVLQEFLAHEARAIAIAIGTLERTGHEAAAASDGARFPLIAPARDALDSLRKERDDLRRLERQRAEQAQSVCRLDDEESRLRTEMAALGRDPSYREAVERRERAADDIRRHRSRVQEEFSALEPLLARLARLTSQSRALIDRYLSDAVEALAEDAGLRIVGVLAEGKDLLGRGVIELKERRRAAALAVLDRLTPDWLMAAAQEHARLRQEQAAHERGIAELPSMSKLAESAGRLREVGLERERLRDRQEHVLKKIAALDIDGKKAAAEHILAGLTGAPVRIAV